MASICIMFTFVILFSFRLIQIRLSSDSISVTPYSIITGSLLPARAKSIRASDVTRVVITAGGRNGVNSISLRNSTTGSEVGFLVPSSLGMTIEGLALEIGKAYGKPVFRIGPGVETRLSA